MFILWGSMRREGKMTDWRWLRRCRRHTWGKEEGGLGHEQYLRYRLRKQKVRKIIFFLMCSSLLRTGGWRKTRKSRSLNFPSTFSVGYVRLCIDRRLRKNAALSSMWFLVHDTFSSFPICNPKLGSFLCLLIMEKNSVANDVSVVPIGVWQKCLPCNT